MKSNKILIILTIMLGFFISAQSVNAAGLALGVYPPILQIQAKPPATITNPITIINNADDPISLSVVFKPFIASEKENGEITYMNQNDFLKRPAEKLFEHIALIDNGNTNITKLTLAPHQKRILTLVIDVPQDLLLSDYYFSILFLSTPDEQSNTSESSVGGGIAMNVLLTVGEKGKTTGYIASFTAPVFLTKGPVPLRVEVANTSLQMISTQGVIIIQNMFGQKIGKIDLLPVNILANSKRFIPDMNQSSQTQVIWPEKFLLGPYTAQVKIALSDQGPVIQKTISFFVFPLEAIIGILLVIIFAVIILVRVRKRLNTFV